MRKAKQLAFVLAAGMVAGGAAAAVQIETAAQFQPERFRAHVAFLADDLLEGRNAGERGYDLAALYVATQFQALGLEPAVDGAWFQHVPFVEYQMTEAPASVRVGRRAFEHRVQAVVSANPLNRTASIEAPVVFVGYGVDMPGQGLDDYSGLNVAGKIVVALSGVPKGLPSEVAAHIMKDKAAMAMARGAVGLIQVRPRAVADKFPFEAMLKYANNPSITWATPAGEPHMGAPSIAFMAMLDKPGEEALFEGAAQSLEQVLDEASRDGARPKGFPLAQTVRIEGRSELKPLYSSPNVLAVLPGSDPQLADEYVLLMGHLDGLGIDRKAEGDGIRNGAIDNATGIASLLETARAMIASGRRPRRSILFAAVTAEEDGLLGSQYLAKNPVLRDGRIVGAVNLDMPILLYDFQDVIAFGAEHSTLGRIVEKAGAQMDIALTPDPLPQEGLFTRSDHYRFVQEGIPSVFLMTGFANGGGEAFKGFLSTNYHRPSDDMKQAIDWDAAAKFARINYLIAREIADGAEQPRWYEGSPFGELFAPAEPKVRKPT